MHTVDELQKVLIPHVSRFSRTVWPVWEHYRKGIPEEHRLTFDQRTEANMLHRYMVANGTREFAGLPGVQLPGKYEFLIGFECFPYGFPGQILVRLKRLSKDGHSRNYPTDRARDIRKNNSAALELEGMPEATFVDVGYVLDSLHTAIVAVQAVRVYGEKFIMSVPREEGGAITMPQTLGPAPQAPRFEIHGRKVKGNAEDDKRS